MDQSLSYSFLRAGMWSVLLPCRNPQGKGHGSPSTFVLAVNEGVGCGVQGSRAQDSACHSQLGRCSESNLLPQCDPSSSKSWARR